MTRLFVAGFDIATSTGCADGFTTSNRPRCWTWDLRAAGKFRPAKLALLRDFCDRYFAENPVDLFFYEQGLRTAAAAEIGMTEATVALLRGAIGVVEACASKARIPHIQGIDVQDARKHLTGQRTFPKGEAKDTVYRWCKTLGWEPTNVDESDACAIWSYGCGTANPMAAMSVTPLFAGR